MPTTTSLIQPAQMTRRQAGPSVENPSVAPLWSIGFRPFFFAATLVALVWVPVMAALTWGLGANSSVVTRGAFSGVTLHAHEMLFGFAGAVIAGFLLTAASNWTGQRTAAGTLLAALVALWTAARLAVLWPSLPSWLVLVLDVSFFPIVAAVLLSALSRSTSRRNDQFLVMLGLLGTANLLMHLEALGWDIWAGAGQLLALRVITLMILVMGGRVIPMFTRNATGATGVGALPILDRVAIGAFLLAALTDFVPFAPSGISGTFLVVAGVLQISRMLSWGTFRARAPLLWILHFGFFMTSGSLLVEGLAQFGALPMDSARHLLTVGGIGGLCLGMMTRVSLGHSGRLLAAPPSMTASFAFLVGATFVRAATPWLAGALRGGAYLLSAALWVGAFGLLLVFGAKIWTSPRADLRATAPR